MIGNGRVINIWENKCQYLENHRILSSFLIPTNLTTFDRILKVSNITDYEIASWKKYVVHQ